MITPEELREYVQLVADVRVTQAYYRKTLDATIRWELPRLEQQLDAATARIAADLLTWCAEAREVALAVEGGAA